LPFFRALARRLDGVFLLLPALVAIEIAFPCHTVAGRLTGAFEAGFDSFTEKYSIVETDTLDQLTEFRCRGLLGYLWGSPFDDHYRIDAQALIGEENYETSARFRAVESLGRSKLSFGGDLSRRAFRSASEYSYANDYLRYNLEGQFSHPVGRWLNIRLADRIEWMDFDKRSEFDYDYVLNTLYVTGDRGGASSGWRAGACYAMRSVPDSTKIDYDAYSGLVEYRRYPDAHEQIFVNAVVERRVYADRTAKSPYWSVSSSASVTPLVFGKFGVTFTDFLESYSYDAQSEVYFGYLENRTAVTLDYFATWEFKSGMGPVFQFLSSSFSEEDEYIEYGLRIALEANRGGLFWMAASYEPARRDYTLDDLPDTETVFSDYTVHRISVYATARVSNNVSLNLFANHEPEDHKREDDDSTVTLFSFDVSYGF
jgi:hypothetical protein